MFYPFDDAKVRHFLIRCISLVLFSTEKVILFDACQHFDIGQNKRNTKFIRSFQKKYVYLQP